MFIRVIRGYYYSYYYNLARVVGIRYIANAPFASQKFRETFEVLQ